MKTLFCTITAMAPLHLGTGEVYEPTSFVLDQNRAELAPFDPLNFVRQLPADARERLQTICRKGTVESLLELYRFYSGHLTAGLAVTHRRVEVCSGVVDQYRKTLGLKVTGHNSARQISKFEIWRTASNPGDDCPYLPGSAVKGAIRTAILNALSKKAMAGKLVPARKHHEFEQKLLGYEQYKFENDPLRLLQVSDFMPAGEVKTVTIHLPKEKIMEV